MVIFRHHSDLNQYLTIRRTGRKSIGFVPTMGALHQGHLSLIAASKAGNERTVASIFVNPAQFNRPEDLRKYPIQTEKDIEKLLLAGCDVLYLPEVKEVYPEGYNKPVNYELGHLDNVLEGKYRPRHFNGVCRVIEALLKSVRPDRLYLGSKDFQQCLVIGRLLDIRHINTEIRLCPIIREASGLAMSSRNQRLSVEEKRIAPLIFQSLQYIRENISCQPFEVLRNEKITELSAAGILVEYLELTSGKLQVLEDAEPGSKMVVLIAVWLGKIRLIDNIML